MFTKDDLRGAKNPVSRIDLEINGKRDCLYVRGMTGAERDSWENEQFEARKSGDKKTLRKYRASLYVRMACDEKGALLCTPEDSEWVKDLPCAVLEPVVEEGQRLSGMTGATVEEISKNSESDSGPNS